MYSNIQQSTSAMVPTECCSAHAPIRCVRDSQALCCSNHQCICQFSKSQSITRHRPICSLPYPHELCTTAAAAESRTGIPRLCDVDDVSSSPHDQAAGSNLATLPTACYSYQQVCFACAEVCQDITLLLCVCSWQNHRLPNQAHCRLMT